MKVLTFVLGDLFVNTYLVINNHKAFIIDPASSDSLFLNELPDVELEYIINTHGHFDHIEGNSLMKKKFNSKIVVHERDANLITNPFFNLSIFVGKKATSPPADIVLSGKENTLELCGIQFKILNTPGHSRGSIILINEEDKMIFSGDLIFKDSIGRIDFPTSNRGEMLESLEIVKRLPDDYFVYPGHGEAFYLKEFKEWSKGLVL